MKHRVGLRVLTIAIAMVFALPIHILMASTNSDLSEYKEYAEHLKTMGLFQGTDRGFELEREPTRMEALVMLIRLLGKEQEVLAISTPTHPFSDVPNWGAKYAAYAYEHKIANGVSVNQFGSNEKVTAAQYYTFVLRALGYDDAKGDFQWDKAVDKAAEVGISSYGQYETTDKPFLRAHLVDISYHSLHAPMKDSDKTLLEKLVSDGLVVEESLVQTNDGNSSSSQGEYFVPIERIASEFSDRNYLIKKADLQKHWPDAEFLTIAFYDNESVKEERISYWTSKTYSEFSREWDAYFGGNQWEFGYQIQSGAGSGLTVWDRKGQFIAIAYVEHTDETKDGLNFETTLPSGVQENIDEARRLSQHAVYIPNDELVRDSYAYPVYEKDGTINEHIQQTLRVNNEQLPAYAREVTRQSYKVFFASSPVKSIEDLGEFPEILLRERISYLLSKDFFGPYSYTDPLPRPGELSYPAPLIRDLSLEVNLEFWLLQDDEGHILAFTYFTTDDLKRIYLEQ